MENPARVDLLRARSVLLRRRASTADPAEQQAIDDALVELDDGIGAVDRAAPLQAAGIVAAAADALETVVASVRMGPFDGFLAGAQQAIDALQHRLGELQGSERLPSAAAAAADAVQTPVDCGRFEALRDEYIDLFDRCRTLPRFAANVDFYAARLVRFKPTYAQLGVELDIPWAFIGVVHAMERGFDFAVHLHNGDPLTARTSHEPRGRPADGAPPFTWSASARDALKLRRLDQVQDWSLAQVLWRLEAWNGFGYRTHAVASPYLWSFSNLYRAGTFLADGRFDAAAVSRQCGAAVMLRALQERGVA